MKALMQVSAALDTDRSSRGLSLVVMYLLICRLSLQSVLAVRAAYNNSLDKL